MRIDNYLYRPAFQKLIMDENTAKYIAQKAPKEDLPDIARACDLFQNSSRNFSFDSSEGKLVAKISEGPLQHLIASISEGKYSVLVPEQQDNMPLRYNKMHWKEAYKSIYDVFYECELYLEDINFVTEKTNRNIENTEDYSKKFEKYI